MGIASGAVLFVAFATGVLFVLTAVLAVGFGVIRHLLTGRGVGWRRIAVLLAVSIPVHALLTFPILVGTVVSQQIVRTRGDESGWTGPRFDAAGRWLVQRSGDAETNAEPPGNGGPARSYAVTSADGTTIRGWFVPAADPARSRAVAVLVHGLWRGGMELEPFGGMFRELDCDVVLVELRNHGRSDRGLATFGLRESDDVVAAVEQFVLAPDGPGHGRPLVLFGVSLGAAAAALAAPRIDGLDGLVLDAPMDDVESTARRLMSSSASGRRRSLDFPWPWNDLILGSVEMYTGVDMAAVNPSAAMERLPIDVAVLVIGAGNDERMPPAVVRGVFDALRTRPERKRLWICEDALHGKVFDHDRDGYRERLRWLVDTAVEQHRR